VNVAVAIPGGRKIAILGIWIPYSRTEWRVYAPFVTAPLAAVLCYGVGAKVGEEIIQ